MISSILFDVMLVLLCYAYVILIILFSTRLERIGKIERMTSRKAVHMMIGNLTFLIPFFSSNVFTVAVAAPFIAVTLIASPRSPISLKNKRLQGLTRLTEGGHDLGLVFYSVSYTVLAMYFTQRPDVIAAGILPMAYGDSFASIMGRRFGGIFFPRLGKKSLEGSIAMFLGSFAVLASAIIYLRIVSPLRLENEFAACLVVSLLAALIESLSPGGYDNILVPLPCALVFHWLVGGI